VTALAEPDLTAQDRAVLHGDAGEAGALAMRVVVGLARVLGAPRLIPVASAHVDGCLYHGRAGVDFTERLRDLGGRVAVPTTLNVGSLDLLHPGLVRLHGEERALARRLMDAHTDLGAQPTWTCAPYQGAHRPERGQDVAWAESNAIVFANSVLGARTDRYGDFLDVCAAVTGRAPYAGLHVPAHRHGQVVLDCSSLPRRLLEQDAAWAALGHLVGRWCGTRVPVLTGLEDAAPDEDRLKALGAAAASSGGVALFHVVGVTPEAPTLAAALGTGQPGGRGAGDLPAADLREVGLQQLRAAREELTTAADGDALDAVSLGTPHYSVTEVARLARLLEAGPPVADGVALWVSTSRAVLEEARVRGHVAVCERAGVRFLVDTCTYVTPVLGTGVRRVMTTSGKWAWYAPANLGVSVVLGALEECVTSARAGRVVRDESLWA
jgi:predicted aconitase